MHLNKFETFVQDLSDKTRNEKAKWTSIGRSLPIRVRNDDFVKRAFLCNNYKKETNLYFIEFIIPTFTISHGEELDKETCVLLVYKKDKLIKELDIDEVDPEIFYELRSAIDKNNDESEDFFNEFDE